MGLYQLLGKETQQRIPGSKLVELEDIGHLPHIEAFDQFITPLCDFLNDCFKIITPYVFYYFSGEKGERSDRFLNYPSSNRAGGLPCRSGAWYPHLHTAKRWPLISGRRH